MMVENFLSSSERKNKPQSPHVFFPDFASLLYDIHIFLDMGYKKKSTEGVYISDSESVMQYFRPFLI
jgi:hypothetical protein